MSSPVTAHDVAAYILKQRGPMSTLKLQKLLYYSQAWSLVWDDAPLFSERIEAWANGPVVREVYEAHRGEFTVSKCAEGNAEALDISQRDTVDSVLQYYGHRTGQWLSDLTHSESPWLEARRGLEAGDRGATEISLGSMADYYSSL